MQRDNRTTDAPPGSLHPVVGRIFGVTHRGTDGETKAYMENGVLWIEDKTERSGWLRCNPGVAGYFSPNYKAETPPTRDVGKPETL